MSSESFFSYSPDWWLPRLIPLSWGGIAVFIGIGVLSVSVIMASDIVATGIVLGGGAILILCLLVISWQIVRLRKLLTITILPSDADISSKKTGVLFAELHGLAALFPGFECMCEFLAGSDGVSITLGDKTSSYPDTVRIPLLIATKHRGIFSIDRCVITVRDRLRLTQRRLSFPINFSFKSHVPHESIPPLPVFAAEAKPGDAALEQRERQGDAFDLRAYQPGDSMRRIVWKVYAKSGELITRHPEPACTPEGDVWIYCTADTRDDDTAATAVAYAKQLEDASLIIHAGCVGMGEAPPATSAEMFSEMLIEKSFLADETDTVKALATFLSHAPALSHLVIVVSAFHPETVSHLGELAARFSINPVFLLPLQRSRIEESTSHWLKKILIEESAQKIEHRAKLEPFIESCLARGWSLVVPEGV